MLRLVKILFFLAFVFFILSLFPSSINWAEDFLDRFSDKSWAGSGYYQLANHCYRTLRFARALELYEKALSKYPEHPMAPLAQFRKAVCLEKIKRYREAISAYREFIRKYPDHPLSVQAKNSLRKLEELQR